MDEWPLIHRADTLTNKHAHPLWTVVDLSPAPKVGFDLLSLEATLESGAQKGKDEDAVQTH